MKLGLNFSLSRTEHGYSYTRKNNQLVACNVHCSDSSAISWMRTTAAPSLLGLTRNSGVSGLSTESGFITLESSKGKAVESGAPGYDSCSFEVSHP